MIDPKPEFRPIDRSEHLLLVVDDNPASLYATVRQLRAAGFRTREAATGAEALVLADDTISAVILDIHLPDIDGFELLSRLRSRPGASRLPVLHLTAAYVTDDDKVRGLDSGADAYLTRPVDVSVLVATVQALVRTRVAEEAMRSSESKFRAIYAQSPSGIGLIGLDGRVLDANPALMELLGRDPVDVIGHRLADFAPPEWAQRLDELALQEAGALAGREVPVRRPDGTLAYLEWHVTPNIAAGTSLVVAHDVSQRMQLAQQRQQLLDRERVARGEAEQVSRMKDDFIAVLSHELRTPLNAIMGWTHVLQKSGGDEQTLRGLAAIERNGRTQARMISDLLDMSRLNLGKLPLRFETLDVAEELQSAVSAMRPSLEEKRIALALDVDGPFRPLRADPARLQQIVWNLLSNAIKFSPDGGAIEVVLAEDGQGLCLTVADHGQGIAPDFLPFVFDRFAQSDAASNRQRGGLGLGLSIVKQLVEAHGGSVAVASAGLGQGARFDVRLPAEPGARIVDDSVPSAFGTLDAPEGAEATLAGLRLLVVDDDPDANAMLRIILSDRGALVHAATDVDGALALLESVRPDVLVSDIGMPGKDGYDLIREVRRREAAQAAEGRPHTARHLPAIALTSFAREQDREQAAASGFDAHCAKPLRPLNLVQQIRQLLDRRP